MFARGWFRRAGRRAADRQPTIGDECDAFLEGRSATIYRAQGRTVPVWAQVNRIARGSHADVVAIASADAPSKGRRPRRGRTWDETITILAQRVLVDARDAPRLREVQEAALWPLESELLAVAGRVELTPDELLVVALGPIVDATDSRRERR